MEVNLQKKYIEEVIPKIKEKFNLTNTMSVPKLEKIVLARGLGEATQNSKVIEISLETFQAISGQKPVPTKSKKAISNFKLREHQIIGCKVTLRNKQMYDFLTKFVNLPSFLQYLQTTCL